jgi:hypothetical protein
MFVRPIQLLKNKIVILDGLTGTGKTMFSPLMASFKGIQNPRFEYMFEYLSIATKSGKISSDASMTLLNLLADVKYYDGSISRDINFRPSDLSGVWSNGNGLKYIQQLFMSDGAAVESRLLNDESSLSLVTHQLLGCADVLERAFGSRLRIIEMVRHPIYLVDHWLSYISMHGESARDFTMWINHENVSIPWFAEQWAHKYTNSNNYDRVIYSINHLMDAVYFHSINKSTYVRFIPFEKFVLNPDAYMDELRIFLDMELGGSATRHLKKQNVPRAHINAGVSKKIYARYGYDSNSNQKLHVHDYSEKYEQIKSQCSDDEF